jgi:tetratricopeptide (TPR) repeat protein
MTRYPPGTAGASPAAFFLSVFLSAAAFLATALALACGPDLAPWILGGDRNALQGPTAFYSQEILRLAPPGTAFHDPGDGTSGAERTAAADRADLDKALQGAPTAQRQAILLGLSSLRDTMALYRIRTFISADEPTPAPGPLPESLGVPEGLPAEFADYLRGAFLYHRQRYPEAAAAWERLLARPEKERRYRSTWAAFMLGKVYLRGDRAKAVEWFQRTRKLAKDGFVDSLGLAEDSYGWEARAERDRGHLDKALALYVNRARAGDASAAASIRIVGRAALEAGRTTGDTALVAVAKDPDAREAMTVFVLSPPYPYDMLEEGDEEAAAWLAAVKTAGVKKVEAADRMAWAAYLAGDFETAGQWLDKAPETPEAAWVRAQLLLRDGKLAEARRYLEKAAEVAPAPPDEGSGPNLYAPFATRDRVRAEQAVVRLTQKDYVPALDLFVTSSYWTDAAYVAERVLTADELKAYVDKQPKTAPPEDGEPYDLIQPSLRYLLGRRLVREDRLAEAAAYLPDEMKPRLQALASDLKKAGDGKLSDLDRSRAGFRAACLTRKEGLELLGTEGAPDWAEYGAYYDLGSPADLRKEQKVFAPSPDELARVERHKARPNQRYHYRYRAADLAWQAAQLLPSGDEKAGVLATAGNWIENDDPKAADRFYKALVRCCGDTDLGRDADDLRWFPEADSCPE